MVHGLWQSAAGLQVQDYRQAILANNLANVDTPGFKPDRITFHERLSAASGAADNPRASHPVLGKLPGGLFESPVYTDFSQAGFETTNGPLDLALAGDGFFVVQGESGPQYTRDGRMIMDRSGALLHAATGRAVADARGRPIVLDRSSPEPVRVDAVGRVYQGEAVAAELAVVEFADKAVLEKSGGNLFDAGGAKARPSSATVMNQKVEASGVDPVASMVEMIEATRTYQMNATMLSLQDETLSRVVNDVGRIG